MPANNRKQSPRRSAPTDLEGRYGKIGISAVEAAARYSSASKKTDRAPKNAGEIAAKQRREPAKK
jgi:hypothetical protein